MSISVRYIHTFQWDIFAKILDPLYVVLGPFGFICRTFSDIVLFRFFCSLLFVFCDILLSVVFLSLYHCQPGQSIGSLLLQLFLFYFLFVLFFISFLYSLAYISFHFPSWKCLYLSCMHPSSLERMWFSIWSCCRMTSTMVRVVRFQMGSPAAL